MRRFIYIGLVLMLCGKVAEAQQHALYSQYLFNLYAVNPAYAGEREAISSSVSYRAQWVGFEGAPSTGNFSIHSPLQNRKLALGLWAQSDVIGARSNISASASFSYKIIMDKGRRISFGVNAGVLNHRYQWDKLEFPDGSDPIAFSADENHWLPNFDAGIMYITRKSYFGASVLSLNGSRTIAVEISDARLDPALHLIGGTIFPVADKIDLKPSFLLRKSMDGPVQFDLNLGARFANALWITTSYRYEFGMVFSAHYFINEKFHFGYAYDLPTNNLLAEQSGTHEIFIGYDFQLFGHQTRSPRNF